MVDQKRIDCYIDTIRGVIWQSQKVQRLFARSAEAVSAFHRYAPQPQSIVQRGVNTMTEKPQRKLFTFVRNAAKSFLAGRLKPENTAPTSAAIWREARKLRDSALTAASHSRLSSLKMMFAALGNVVLHDQRRKFGRQGQSYFESVRSAEMNFGRDRHTFCGVGANSVLRAAWDSRNVLNCLRLHQPFICLLTGKTFVRQFLNVIATLADNAVLVGAVCTFITSLKSETVEART